MAVANELSLGLKAKLFRGFGDPSRLALLDALRAGERSVSELVRDTGLAQSSVSGHLACLRECGLVISRRDGRYVFYALADQRVAAVLAEADGILADVGERVYACTRYAT